MIFCAVLASSANAAPENAIAYWTLDDEVGASVAADELMLSSGILRGDTMLGVPGVSEGSTAAYFDGSGDYIEIPHVSGFLINQGTVMFWFKPDSLPSRAELFSKDSTDYDTGGHLTIGTDSSGRVNVRLQSTARDYTCRSSAVITEDQWHHVAFSFGSEGMELYVDGVLEDSDDYTGGMGVTLAGLVGAGSLGNREPLVLGGNTWQSGNLVATPVKNYFTGTMDNVVILSEQIDAETVADLAGIEIRQQAFTDISSDTGFDVSSGSGANGIQWGDLDDDGDPDAMITGSRTRLFWNDLADDTFVVKALGSMPRQAVIADFDNDGDADYFNSNLDLWENIGLGSMINRGGLGVSRPSNIEAIVAIDVDTDGRLDLILPAANGNWIARNSDPGADYRTRISFETTNNSSDGLNLSRAYGNGDFCSTADVNNDSRLDIFYHYNGGQLFLSNDDGTFTASPSSISVTTGNNDKMGSAFADYDNDGDMDLWVSRYDSNQRGYLLRNDNGVFIDVTLASGLNDAGNQRGCAWGDYNNDGYLDLAIARQGQGLILYRNTGAGRFIEETDLPTVSGNTTDVCFVDYDNDGDLDLSVSRENGSATLLRNNQDDQNYLRVRFAGGQAVNARGIGVRVELWNEDNTTRLARRELGLARGYGGQEPIWAHFGGVDPASSYTLRVYQPGASVPITTSVIPGRVSTQFSAQSVRQMITISESTNTRARVVLWKEIGGDHNR